MPSKKTEPTFEEAMLQIEQIVRRLEKGESTLEESVKLFEEGTGLIALCDKRLNEAEAKVVLLSGNPDTPPTEKEFAVEAE